MSENIDKIVEYVMNTPQNSNPAVLEGLLEGMGNNSDSTENTNYPVMTLHATDVSQDENQQILFYLVETDEEIIAAYDANPNTIFVITEDAAENDSDKGPTRLSSALLGSWICTTVEITSSPFKFGPAETAINLRSLKLEYSDAESMGIGMLHYQGYSSGGTAFFENYQVVSDGEDNIG